MLASTDHQTQRTLLPLATSLSRKLALWTFTASITHSSVSHQRKHSMLLQIFVFHWKLLSRRWKTPIFLLRKSRVVACVSLLLLQWKKATSNFYEAQIIFVNSGNHSHDVCRQRKERKERRRTYSISEQILGLLPRRPLVTFPCNLLHDLLSCVGREHYRYRFACVVNNMQDLIARIEDRLQSSSSSASGGNARRILIGFSGQGSQYQAMGRYLANQYSGFRSIITDAANKASALTGYPILPYLVEESAPGNLSIDHSEVAQVCIFIFQYAVSTWLESLGVHSHAVMGHSLEEIAAAVIARAFNRWPRKAVLLHSARCRNSKA
ncbi:acyl transferase/acyl hydrolase/lysophospholipase [Flammula alnicola]|nr:acyl transferase/acyl hydrolase/lysophospholipase [Flammula alnicola]